jgi:hypothetical protein
VGKLISLYPLYCCWCGGVYLFSLLLLEWVSKVLWGSGKAGLRKFGLFIVIGRIISFSAALVQPALHYT